MTEIDRSRRDALKLSVAFAVSTTLFVPHSRAAIPPLEPDKVDALIRQRLGNKPPVPGPIELKIPALSESGNSVPLTVSVDSPPETSIDHVLVVATRNRRPMVLDVHFGAGAPKAQFSTRIRVNETQTLLAFAKLRSGTVWSAQTDVEVVIGACEGLGFTY